MRMSGLILTGAVLLGSVAMTGTAHAAEACRSGWVCVYGNNDFEWKIGERAPGNTIANIASQYNDKMDSYWNGSGTNAAWYENDKNSERNPCHDMKAHKNDNNISVLDSDQLTAWRTDRGC